ncbi:hypothetical protein K7X08_035479 [Anisodus acutangulus]|uniref:Uncharacterized protein n=1 Tax=Anisodus acutangulus TaxID=402998 RepID=A0A9Q1R2M3_9SOLA|nr:hypothetical protein K7X08_035479 [Anisodus acutangulus]
MKHFPVALQLIVDASSSFGAIFPRGLIDHLIDGFVSGVKKQLDDERSAIINQITVSCSFWFEYDFESRFDCLDTHFEDLDSRFIGVINVVENLVRGHDESKSFEVDNHALHSQQIGDVNMTTVKATTVDISILDEVSCKHRRCDDGKKDDNDPPRWNLITPKDNVIEKCTISGD